MAGFSSALMINELVIDEGMVPDKVYNPSGCERGLDLSARPNADDYGYGAAADPFPAEWLIPESEWQARIQELEERKSRLSDIAELAGLTDTDQNGLNYCWIASPCYANELVGVSMNQPLKRLSHASAGARIKNFRNVGGWGKEALDFLAEHGCNLDADWPKNSLDRKYLNSANIEKAKLNRVTEWVECQPRNLKQIVSCLLRRVPLCGGFNWWGHEVTLSDVLWLDGTVAIRIRNQWAGWGTKGYGILQGSRMLADDLVGPRVRLAA